MRAYIHYKRHNTFTVSSKDDYKDISMYVTAYERGVYMLFPNLTITKTGNKIFPTFSWFRYYKNHNHISFQHCRYVSS